MSKLCVFDVSPVIYAGSTFVENPSSRNMYGQNGTVKGLPTGGIRMLIDRIFSKIKQGWEIALVFDSKTNKNTLFEGYKSQRVWNPEVSIQRKMFQELAPEVGFNVFSKDNFEADDIIFNVVMHNLKNYAEIEILTGDSDIAAAIFCDRVHISGASSKDKSVNVQNFAYIVRGDATVVYNTISAYTVLYGKPSNNFPVFAPHNTALRENIYKGYTTYCDSLNVNQGMRSIQLYWDNYLETRKSDLDDSQFAELQKRSGIVFSEIYSGDFSISSNDALNKSKLAMLLRMFELYNSAKIADVEITPGNFDTEHRRYLDNYLNMWHTGNFNIDNDFPADTTVFDSPIDDAEFELNVGGF